MVWEALAAEGAAAESAHLRCCRRGMGGAAFQPVRRSAIVKSERAAAEAAQQRPPVPASLAPVRSPLPAALPRPLSPSGASAIIDGDGAGASRRLSDSDCRRRAPPPRSSAAASSTASCRSCRTCRPASGRRPPHAISPAPAPAGRRESRARLAESVFGVLDDPAFAPVFALREPRRGFDHGHADARRQGSRRLRPRRPPLA